MKSLAALLFLAVCSTAVSQNDDDRKESELTTKVYRIDGLQKHSTSASHAVPAFTAEATSASPAPTVHGGFGGQGGGLGGGSGGLGGGGFGGGGGQFSVSEPMGSQFGTSSVHMSRSNSISNSTPDDIVSLISNCVDPTSWLQTGGSGVIDVFGDALVVRQTAANHAQISALLAEVNTEAVGNQPINVALWLIKADSAMEQQLPELIIMKDATQKLTNMAESTQGYHVDVRTMDRMNATMSDGTSTSVISSRVPVVGTNASGSQPIATSIFEGFSAAVHPRLLPASEETGIQLSVSTQVTAIEDLVRYESTGREADSFHLRTRNVNGTVLCEPDKPIIAGSLSVRSGQEQNNIEKWILVACASLPKLR